MTKYAITIAAALFSATTLADEVYHGLAAGNPDLFDGNQYRAESVGIQPGIGDSFDIYLGLGIGNQDLFNPVSAPRVSGSRPNIYQGFRANPDLHY